MPEITLKRLVGASLLLLVAALILIVLWQSITARLQETANEQIQSSVTATITAESARREQQAPTLLAPGDSASFDNAAAVTLEWTWYRPLADDEFFDLRVWRDGDPANGITWSKDQSFLLRDWLLYQQPGDFLWTVGVVRQNEDGSGTEISALETPQHFTMSAIDLKIMDVPAEFTVSYYARLPFSQPTVITFGEDGALYALSVSGDVARLSDEDGDHFAETVTALYDDSEDKLDHAVGMAFHQNILYISDAGRISTLTDSNGDNILDTLTPIVEGLPTQWHTFHSNNGIVFGPDGKLYVGVGSTTDHGPLQIQYEASILRMNPDGSDLETFATGFRNPYDLVFTPQGALFTADNSPDEPDVALPYLPPEEIDYVEQGKDYGFPGSYGFPDSASNTAPPVVELMTSSASSGITYYDQDGFPPAYHGLYLAQFGTGAAFPSAANVNTGRQVILVTLTPDDHGGYVGTWSSFARFSSEGDIYQPIDVTVGADGALYIAEWTSATVYRVTYSGATGTLEAAESAAQVGRDLFVNGANEAPACINCHALDASNNTLAPSLVGLAAHAASRAPGLSAEDYVRQSITTPDAFIVDNYGSGLMYQDYVQKLTPEQIDALVAYVLSL